MFPFKKGFKKSKPNSDKVATTKNNKRQKNDLFDKPKKMPPSKKFYLFDQEVGQKGKMVIKIGFTPLISHALSRPDCKMFPFKKGFKKHKVDLTVVNCETNYI